VLPLIWKVWGSNLGLETGYPKSFGLPDGLSMKISRVRGGELYLKLSNGRYLFTSFTIHNEERGSSVGIETGCVLDD
jgi:hypothetical protein